MPLSIRTWGYLALLLVKAFWATPLLGASALQEVAVALQEAALEAPLGAVRATWTAPWTEWGARCCKT